MMYAFMWLVPLAVSDSVTKDPTWHIGQWIYEHERQDSIEREELKNKLDSIKKWCKEQ